VKEHFGVEHSTDIKMDDFQAILHWLDPKGFDAPETKTAPRASGPPDDADASGADESDLFDDDEPATTANDE
jgi:hypothetical protein